MVTALVIMGNSVTHFEKNPQFEKALKAFDDALDICNEHSLDLLRSYVLVNKGLLLTYDHRYFDDGLEMLENALIMAQNMYVVQLMNSQPYIFSV